MRLSLIPLSLAATLVWAPARADITIGALLSLTGPGAGLGIPERDTIGLLPATIAGQAVHWQVIDDKSDTSAAVQAASKMTSGAAVDVILGPSTTADSVAILDTAGRSGTAFVSLSGSSAMIVPPEGDRRWAFKMLPSEQVATGQLAAHMAKAGVKTLASIGFANALGDGYIGPMTAEAAKLGIRTVADVRYNPTDTALTPQVLRVMQAQPGAVFIAASATPATTPIIELRQRGYTGPIYTVQGIAGPDALRVGGKALNGVIFSAVPVLVAEQLPDGDPVKAPAMAFVAAFEGQYGAGSRSLFGATLWDAFALVAAAAPDALAHGKPGSAEFRLALRDAMERVHGLAGAQGVFSLTPTDHSGADPASQVLVSIQDGGYRLVQ